MVSTVGFRRRRRIPERLVVPWPTASGAALGVAAASGAQYDQPALRLDGCSGFLPCQPTITQKPITGFCVAGAHGAKLLSPEICVSRPLL